MRHYETRSHHSQPWRAVLDHELDERQKKDVREHPDTWTLFRYVPDPQPWTTLGELRAGAVFECSRRPGRFVKPSWNSDEMISLEDGGGSKMHAGTEVREIPLPERGATP